MYMQSFFFPYPNRCDCRRINRKQRSRSVCSYVRSDFVFTIFISIFIMPPLKIYKSNEIIIFFSDCRKYRFVRTSFYDEKCSKNGTYELSSVKRVLNSFAKMIDPYQPVHSSQAGMGRKFSLSSHYLAVYQRIFYRISHPCL